MKTYLLFVVVFTFSSAAVHAQDTLTRGEVFDFEIGDHFEYEGDTNNQPPNAKRKTVIDKYYSADGDTVFYAFHNNNYTLIISDPVDYFTEEYIDTVWYTHLDQNISDEWLPFDSSNFASMNLMYFDPNLCGAEINGFEINTPEFETATFIRTYGRGLGLTRWYTTYPAEFPPEQVDYSLFHYSKVNGIYCGTPDSTLLTSLVDIPIERDFSVFPNPARESFLVSAHGARQAELTLYDLSGRVVYRSVLKNDKARISAEGFAPGMYLVQVRDEKGAAVRKIVVE